MRTYEEAFAAAKDEPAFSNGTEGFAWTGTWCDTCLHDKGTRDGTDEKGCPLIMVALMQRTPVEWIEQPWQQIKGRPEGETAPTLGDTYHCTEYAPDDDEGGDDEPDPGPRWDPEMPGQTTIFEVFTDQFVEGLQQLERVTQ